MIEALASRASPAYAAALRDAGPARTGVPAVESVPAALRAFCAQPDDFEALLESINAAGGDTDTIGAMAGALLGTLHGAAALPQKLLGRLEARERLIAAGRALAAARG